MNGPFTLENILFLALSGAAWVGVTAAVVLYARRMLRAVERRSVAETQVALLTERLQQLEARVESVSDDTERLHEDQRFTRQLLIDRRAGSGDRFPA